MLGSDIGHWDVTDTTEVLPEAYELVENGLFTPHSSGTSPATTPSGCTGR